jgi:hypothetical protein
VEQPGFFWLPERPDLRVAGRLVLSSGNVRVELLGSLSPGASFGGSEPGRYPVVLGQLHRAVREAGTEVTLLGAFTREMSWSSTGVNQTIAANRLFVGEEHLGGAEDAFVEARVVIAGLAAWVPARAFDVAMVERTVRTHSENVTCVEAHGASIELRTRADLDGATADEVHVAKRSEVVIRPSSPLSESAFNRDFFVPLRNLVTLGTNSQASIESLELVLRDQPRWPPVVHDLLPDRLAGTLRRQDRAEPFFALPDESDGLGTMLERWLTLSSRHRRVLGLVFGLLESPPYFAEMRFDLTARALDLVGARIVGASSLGAFIESMPEAASKLVGSRELFCDTVARVRARMWDDEAPLGLGLYYMTETMTWLLKLRLAVEAGVPVEEAANSRAFVRAAKGIHQGLERLSPPGPA